MMNALRKLRGFLGRREQQIVRQMRDQRRLAFESMEDRRLLSVNAADAINGTVFADANANNMFDVGEGIEGATLMLYLDNGDGNFDPNNGDIQIGAAATTDANGEYCFTSLDQSATYFVRQPQQTVGGQNLPQQDSAAITFRPQLIIDEFDTTQTTVAVPPPISTDSSSLAFPNEDEVLGAERDLAVELTAGMSEIQLRVNPFNQQDVLLFDSSAGTIGQRIITWDGQDNDGQNLALGLNGVDLTQGGTLTAFSMLMGVDANGGNAAIRIYQGNTTTPSEVTVPIPQTDGTASVWVNIPFTSLSGPVSPDNVDAIELELLTGNSSVDGQIDVIGTAGARASNFDNDVTIDLEVEKTADVAQVNAGDTVTWTITLSNNDSTTTVGDGNATATATGVVVSDVLPAGVSFVSASPSNGGYANGVWTLADGIAPGGQETLTLVTTVNSGLAGGTALINTAQVTAHDQPDIDSQPNNDDGDQSEDDEDNAEVTVGEAVDLEVTKVVDQADVEPGDQVTFTITITNNANTANTSATGVEVTDSLPAGMTLVSGTPSGNGTFDAPSRVWSLVDPLMPGAQQTLTIIADVNAGVQGDSTLSNVAQVTAVNETDVDSAPANDDGDQSEDDEDMAMFTVGAVIDLSVSKTANAQTVDPGDMITWVVSVTNDAANANADATNVQITDVLPTGLTLTSAIPSGNGQFSNGVWSLIDPLAPGAMATLTLMTTVDAGVQPGDLTNTAQVTAADQPDVDSTPANDDGDQSEDDEAADSVTVNPQIDLEVTKTVSQASAQPGDQVTWTVVVTNNAQNANASATGVTITDVVPAGLIANTVTPSNGAFANDVWTLADPLAPGGTASLTLVTTVDPDTTLTTIDNVAQVSAANEADIDSTPNNDDGDQSEDDEDTARISVTPNQIDLELNKTASQAVVQVGEQVTWTLTVTNNAANANASATGVAITDVLPNGLISPTITPSNGTFANNVWTLADPLAPGASESLTILATVDPSTALSSIDNVAQVSAANEADIDSTPGNDDGDQSEDDEDIATITVTPSVIDLELNKSVNASLVDPGDSVNWTISVSNNVATANTDATGVTITDVLPTGVTLVSSTPSTGSFAGNTWNLGTLAPGATATLTLATTVDNSLSGGTVITNVAQVASANENDSDSTPGNDDGDQSEDDEDSAAITLRSVVDLELVKSADQSLVDINDSITWTIQVTNNQAAANTSATGVTISDVLPTGTTFVSANPSLGTFDSNTGIWSLGSSLQPGQSATLEIVSTVDEGSAGQTLVNTAQVATQDQPDVDSTPGDGQQNDDDDSEAEVIVQLQRPMSKRSLLATS